MLVTAGAVAANADPQVARRAALPLGLVDGVHQALPHPVEVAVGPTQPGEFLRERVLDVLVLAATSLEHEPNLDLVFAVLVEVDDRGARSEIVATVLAGQGIDRIGAELARLGRAGHRLVDLLFQHQLVVAHGVLTRNVGMPVSWQMGRSVSQAMSTFKAMVAKARDEFVSGVSRVCASAISRRMSEGRLVEVWTISS